MNRLRLLLAFFRLGVEGELAYRVNFWIQLAQSVLSLAMSLGGLAIIFSYTDNLGGWRPEQVLALVGVYFLVGGLIGLMIQPGMEQLIESVRDGTLDFTLTKPEDAQVVVSLQRLDIWKLIDIAMGLLVLMLALLRLGDRISPAQVGGFALMLLAGGVIVYSFWLVLATLAFWFVRVENILVIFQSLYEAGRWPLSLYPAWLRYGLTFLVPVAFAVTVPAEAVTRRLTPATGVEAVVIAVVIFFLARAFWRLGLKHYSGASA